MPIFKKMIYTYCVYEKFFVILQPILEKGMPVYQEKAKKNYEAAAHLVALGEGCNMYIPSAHMAYYSAFLIIKHALAKSNTLTYDQQEQIAESSTSHNEIFSVFMDTVRNIAPSDANDFMVNFNKLKKLRQMADYKTDKSKLTYIHMQETVERAKDYYNNVASLYKINP